VAMQNLRDKRTYQLKEFCATLSAGGYLGCLGNAQINGHIERYGSPYMLHIWYDEKDTSGTSFGCLDSDCRMPTAFGIIDQT
jgi:hypothetical protein